MKKYYAVVKISYEYQVDLELDDDTDYAEAERLAIEEARIETGASIVDNVEIVESRWR